MHIYVLDFIQKNREFSFAQLYEVHVLKCWNGATYMKRKWTCIFVLSVKRSAILKLLERYGCSNIFAPKNDFSLFSFSLN